MPKIRVPVMIDTTDAEAIEKALTFCQGKAIINSVNLEDGEEKFERVCPLARKYGAALVVGTIDEDKLQAQAFTRERKLAVAQRSVDLLTTKYGIPPRTSSSIRWCSPALPATRTTSAARWRPSKPSA